MSFMVRGLGGAGEWAPLEVGTRRIFRRVWGTWIYWGKEGQIFLGVVALVKGFGW